MVKPQRRQVVAMAGDDQRQVADGLAAGADVAGGIGSMAMDHVEAAGAMQLRHPMAVPRHAPVRGQRARMPGHRIGHGSRVEGALRSAPGGQHDRLVSQGEKLPGQGVDDDFLSAQLRQRLLVYKQIHMIIHAVDGSFLRLRGVLSGDLLIDRDDLVAVAVQRMLQGQLPRGFAHPLPDVLIQERAEGGGQFRVVGRIGDHAAVDALGEQLRRAVETAWSRSAARWPPLRKRSGCRGRRTWAARTSAAA